MFENPFETKTYLVIDDFGDMRSMIKGLLRALGATHIDAARNAREALGMMARTRFDVVLCDYNLGPGKNGQQLLEEARHRRLISIATVFVMITAENTREMVMASVEFEPDSYLSKPFTKELLRTRLLKLLQRKADLQPVNDALERKDYPRAIELLDQRIAGRPKNLADLIRLKADFCFQSQRYDEASEIYRGVLASREVPWARLGTGKIQYARGQLAEALETFTQLTSQCKTLMAAWDWLARTQRALGDVTNAERTLQAAVALSPRVVTRQQALGELALHNRNYTAAEQAYANAVELGEHSIYRNPAAYAGLARARSGEGRHDDAERVLDDLRQAFDDQAGAFYAATAHAAVCEDRGDHQGALAQLQQAEEHFRQLGRDAPADAALALARSCARVGKSEQAEQLLRNAVRNNHDNDDLLAAAADVYREAGIADDAGAEVKAIRQEVIDMNNRGVGLIAAGQLDEAIALFTRAADSMEGNLVINVNATRALIISMERRGLDAERLELARRYLDRARRLGADDSRVSALAERLHRLTADTL